MPASASVCLSQLRSTFNLAARSRAIRLGLPTVSISRTASPCCSGLEPRRDLLGIGTRSRSSRDLVCPHFRRTQGVLRGEQVKPVTKPRNSALAGPAEQRFEASIPEVAVRAVVERALHRRSRAAPGTCVVSKSAQTPLRRSRAETGSAPVSLRTNSPDSVR